MSPLGGRGFPHPSKPIISPFGAGHQLDKLSMLEPFSEYWVYFSLLSFLYNPFCNSILLIKDQTFCLLRRKCPVTYMQKTNFLWELNDRQQSSTGSKLNQVTVSKRCRSPQTMPVFICKSSINICFFFLLLMFLQLFNLHLCWQASTIRCKIWLLAHGRVCVAQ